MTDLPADQNVDVLFVRDLPTARSSRMTSPTILIFPDPQNWNDYGRRLFADMRIYKDGEISGVAEPIRFMFEGQTDTDIAIRALFKEYGDIVPIERSGQLYTSLLATPDAYREFVRLLGFDYAVSALRKMGDAVVVRLEGRDEARLNIIDSEAFYVSILRGSDAYSALRRGGRYLRRDDPENVADAANSFYLVASLPNISNRYALEIDFADDLIGRNRVSVLIGKNGVGKTQLLRHLILSSAEGFKQGAGFSGRLRTWPRPKFKRLLMFSSVRSDPYPESIPAWFGIDYEYFSMTASRDQGSDALLQALVACRRDPDFILVNGNVIGRSRLLQSILERMGIWEQVYLPLRAPRDGEDLFAYLATRWQDRRYVQMSLNLNERLSLALVREIDWNSEVVIFANNRLRHLSSGELAMFRFAAQAVMSIEQGSLLLFDEPETHLHPNFISEFIDILQDLLAATNSAAIIATHSAYIVREVPRTRVNVLTVTDGDVQVDAPRMQTFGASIDTISQFVFRDTSIPHRYQQVLRQWMEGPGRDFSIDEIVDRYGNELNPESLSYLAGLKRGLERGDGA